jgi:hypothetical protein
VEQTELATRASVSLETVKRLERIRGMVDANTRTIVALHQAFEGLGVELIWHADGVGVRTKPGFSEPGA